jgi:hypothetical protein
MELKSFVSDKRNAIISVLVVFLCGFGLGYGVSLANRHEGVVVDSGDWEPLKTGEHHYCFTLYNDSIWGGYVDSYYTYKALRYCPFVDKGSLRVSRSSGYAKDKNHVYYPLGVDYLSEPGDSDCPMSVGMRVTRCIIEEADPATFKVIGNGYAIDSRYMYYEGYVIRWDKEVIRSHGNSCSNEPKRLYVEPIPYEFDLESLDDEL